MLNAGDVITSNFIGVQGAKRRPGIIVSSDLYHQHRPDVIVALLTTNIAAAITPLDYILQDWAVAGLRQPSAFRSYFNMELPAGLRLIGGLETDRQALRTELASRSNLPSAYPCHTGAITGRQKSGAGENLLRPLFLC